MSNCHLHPWDTIDHLPPEDTIPTILKRIQLGKFTLKVKLTCRSVLRPRVTQPHAKKKHTARPPKKATHQRINKNQREQPPRKTKRKIKRTPNQEENIKKGQTEYHSDIIIKKERYIYCFRSLEEKKQI